MGRLTFIYLDFTKFFSGSFDAKIMWHYISCFSTLPLTVWKFKDFSAILREIKFGFGSKKKIKSQNQALHYAYRVDDSKFPADSIINGEF